MNYVYLANWSSDADADGWNDDRPFMSCGDLADVSVAMVVGEWNEESQAKIKQAMIDEWAWVLEDTPDHPPLRFTIQPAKDRVDCWQIVVEHDPFHEDDHGIVVDVGEPVFFGVAYVTKRPVE